MKIIDKESTTGKIIRGIGFGFGVVVGLSNQHHSYQLGTKLIKELFGDKKPKNINKYFNKLRQQKIISIKEDGDKQILVLTEKGKEIFLKFNYDKIKIKEQKIWDGYFRMVIFDIPEKHRNARNSFRDKLKELGFVKFNDSVWVYPFSCQKEIDFIANFWKVGKYVQFCLVKDLTNKEKLENFFNL